MMWGARIEVSELLINSRIMKLFAAQCGKFMIQLSKNLDRGHRLISYGNSSIFELWNFYFIGCLLKLIW